MVDEWMRHVLILATLILLIPLMPVLPLPPPPWVLMLLPILVFGALVAQALFHTEVHVIYVLEKQLESTLLGQTAGIYFAETWISSK
uniref:Uncharacterized protein n=1 Tax=Physcomitrium patens TaxID=3218 RepID=A0A2K1IHF7_PHYPA|nr:hypothetical protein PHYPA_029310 [Physcomitrium patens]